MDRFARTCTDTETFESWLTEYGWAWVEADADAASRLFTDDADYAEAPFRPLLHGKEAIGRYWNTVAKWRRGKVQFEFDILAIERDTGVAHWQVRYRDPAHARQVTLDGVLLARFDEDNRCREFKAWWQREERRTPEAGSPLP